MSHHTIPQESTAVFRAADLERNWRWLLALGIVWIVLGSFAIVMPFAAALALELVLGAIFVIGGLAQGFQAFHGRNDGAFMLHLFGGLLAVVLGGLLLFFPLEGVLTLTLLLSAFFIAEGAVKLLWAFQHRSLSSWRWVLFSGLLGIAAGLLIWFVWPGSALWALGLVVGIELIFSGWAMAMLAVAARRTAA